ncbi:MAG: hypothetical protein AAGF12_00020 [Myxococcota bacterium]
MTHRFLCQASCVLLLAAVSASPELCTPSAAIAQSDTPSQTPSETPSETLSATRLLRRLQLTLTGRAPTRAEYESIVGLPEQAQYDAVWQQADEWMASSEFEGEVHRWAREYLNLGSYPRGNGCCGVYYIGHASTIRRCADGTRHAGALTLSGETSLCDDGGASASNVEPWWEPGGRERVLGTAGNQARTNAAGEDCGILREENGQNNEPTHAGCGCGPNLIYCARGGHGQNPSNQFNGIAEVSQYDPRAIRRSAFEEPARLLAHIVLNDRPFSDLVAGNYTVVNRGLHFQYVRHARQDSGTRSLDDTDWWRRFDDPTSWLETPFSELNPRLLDARDTRFDPATDAGEPAGIPSAGVFSTLVGNSYYDRERVRAARWLETFACRDFFPPPEGIEFNEYERDPATEGECQHCHQVIDPAAIYFKRTFHWGGLVAGIGSHRIETLRENRFERLFIRRVELTFEPDTLLTPVSAEVIARDENARFVDFLPEGTRFLGVASDGTIGPLGFAKHLVQGGEFDRCAVRRIHERFGGWNPTPGAEEGYIRELVEHFTSHDRSVRSLIAHILRTDGAGRGL